MTNFVFGVLIGLAIVAALALIGFIWLWTEFEAMGDGVILPLGQ